MRATHLRAYWGGAHNCPWWSGKAGAGFEVREYGKHEGDHEPAKRQQYPWLADQLDFLENLEVKVGETVVDSYNANPSMFKERFVTLTMFKKKRSKVRCNATEGYEKGFGSLDTACSLIPCLHVALRPPVRYTPTS